MAHISESEFTEDHVIPWLQETHPDARLVANHYLGDEPEGYADLWVDLGSHILAIEVGNNHASIREEAAQAQEYADHHPAAVPMVVVPEDHGSDTAIDHWRSRNVLIRLLPTE